MTINTEYTILGVLPTTTSFFIIATFSFLMDMVEKARTVMTIATVFVPVILASSTISYITFGLFPCSTAATLPSCSRIVDPCQIRLPIPVLAGTVLSLTSIVIFVDLLADTMVSPIIPLPMVALLSFIVVQQSVYQAKDVSFISKISI